MHAVDEGSEVEPWRRRVRRGRKPMPLWQEMPLLLIVAFGVAVLIRTFLLQAFFIPSGSMEDTLLVGDRVLVNKVVYDFREPRRGEIVVFRGTDAWAPQIDDAPQPGFLGRVGRGVGDLVGFSRPGEKDFIKRVIGLPGDRVRCCDNGRVVVNGVPLDERAYVTEDSPVDLPPNPRECRSRQFDEIVVPPGQLWVMGDHRLVSQDSRCQGTVPIDNLIGRATLILWPRWTDLSVPDTFASVPAPKPVAAPADGPRSPVPGAVGGIATAVPVAGALGALVGSRRPRVTRRRRLLP